MVTSVKSKQSMSQEENAVQRLGFEYEITDIPLSKIDPNASAYNYRFQRLDEEKALQYGLAMEKGDEFPPVIVHIEGNQYVPDAGVHRIYGRTNFTNFKTISAVLLKNVDLSDQQTNHDLDLLRVRTNLGHGLGLDQAERKMVACQWIDSGFMTEKEAAVELDLDPKALTAALENYRLDQQLLNYGLHPENFRTLNEKKSVLRKGLVLSDMKAIERLIVTWTAENVRHKITQTQINKLSLDLSNTPISEEKQVILDSFNTEIRASQGVRTRTQKVAPSPQWFFKTGIGALRNVNTKAFADQQSKETAESVTDEIYATILKLAGVYEAVAKKNGSVPKITVIR